MYALRKNEEGIRKVVIDDFFKILVFNFFYDNWSIFGEFAFESIEIFTFGENKKFAFKKINFGENGKILCQENNFGGN